MLLSSSPAAAVDCNACRYSCGSINPIETAECTEKKELCFLTGQPFNLWVSGVENACANDPGRMDAQGKIDEARNLLVANGVFSSTEFDGVKFRWCSALSIRLGDEPAAGMVPSSGKVLLRPDFKSASTVHLAELLAHEMIHIRQYRRWGSSGFHCRYSREMGSSGSIDTGRGNRVEREAYEFVDGLSLVSQAVLQSSR